MRGTSQIHKAVSILQSGGCVVFPTETAYGLAADATNAQAVERVMAIKGREGWKTPPLIAAHLQMVEAHCVLSPLLRGLVNTFWPGPLTIVAPIFLPEPGPGSGNVRNTTGFDTNTRRWYLAHGVVREGMVAIRVSSHPVAQALSRELGAPIVATSANVAGEPACYDIASVKSQFTTRPLQPDFYLNGGVLEKRSPSTIVTEQNGALLVLRQGEIVVDTCSPW